MTWTICYRDSNKLKQIKHTMLFVWIPYVCLALVTGTLKMQSSKMELSTFRCFCTKLLLDISLGSEYIFISIINFLWIWITMCSQTILKVTFLNITNKQRRYPILCNENENTSIRSFGNIGIGVEIGLKKFRPSFCY